VKLGRGEAEVLGDGGRAREVPATRAGHARCAGLAAALLSGLGEPGADADGESRRGEAGRDSLGMSHGFFSLVWID
jgi:hypothetical protein